MTSLCLFSDLFINELRFGRRGAIIVSAVSVLIAAILGSATQKTWQFALSRVLLGFGMGCKASGKSTRWDETLPVQVTTLATSYSYFFRTLVVPVFAAEIAPPHLRGMSICGALAFEAVSLTPGRHAGHELASF